MCSHPLSQGSCVDRLLGEEECRSPLGTYELIIPKDNTLSCDQPGIRNKNCKDLDVSGRIYHPKQSILYKSGLLLLLLSRPQPSLDKTSASNSWLESTSASRFKISTNVDFWSSSTSMTVGWLPKDKFVCWEVGMSLTVPRGSHPSCCYFISNSRSISL